MTSGCAAAERVTPKVEARATRRVGLDFPGMPRWSKRSPKLGRLLLLVSSLGAVGCSSSTTNQSTGGSAGVSGSGGSAGLGGAPGGGTAGTSAGTGGGASTSYADVVLADGPIGFYRLNETSGATAVDSSPSKLDGQYSTTGITLGAIGATGGDLAVTFDKSATMTVPGASFGFFGKALFSLEGWFRPHVVDAVRRRLLWRFTGANGYVLESSATSGLRFLRTQDLNDSVISAPPLVVQKYSHVVATYDGTDACLYVNGTKATCGPSPQTIGSGVSPFMISGSSDAFEGEVDEVAVYATALSPDRVLEHYQAGTAK